MNFASENSLVGPNDDGEPTYTELQRCDHCLGVMSSSDALDHSHNECLKNERLAWICNEEICGHEWECLGIPMQCPVCQGYNVDSADYSRLTDLRVKIVAELITDGKVKLSDGPYIEVKTEPRSYDNYLSQISAYVEMMPKEFRGKVIAEHITQERAA